MRLLSAAVSIPVRLFENSSVLAVRAVNSKGACENVGESGLPQLHPNAGTSSNVHKSEVELQGSSPNRCQSTAVWPTLLGQASPAYPSHAALAVLPETPRSIP